MTRFVRFYLYRTCDIEGLEMVWFIEEKDVAGQGGVDCLETELRRNFVWFYPLGELLATVRRGGYAVEVAQVAPLVEAWKQAGSPKIFGDSARSEGKII
jgi:hypothetical protein